MLLFCVGKKNWVIINSVKRAQASATCYSLAESAKANNLRPYEYFKHLLTEMPKRMAGEEPSAPGNAGRPDAMVRLAAGCLLQEPLKSGFILVHGAWFDVYEKMAGKVGFRVHAIPT